MSYILDALKKIEHEKNKRARTDGRINITGDLFQERKQPAATAGKWRIVAVIAAVALLACAGTWLLLMGAGMKSTARIPAAPPITPLVPPPSPVAPPVSPPIPAPTAQVAAPAVAAPVTQKTNETVADDEAPREARRLKRAVAPQTVNRKQPEQTVQAPADMKLSGIAWQDERAARRAVINGFLLKEGAIVSGAKITEIRADRVRFQSAAGVFEIKLDAVLPAGVQR